MPNEMQKLLNQMAPLNNGSAERHDEFVCSRILSEPELVTACYQNLKSWKDNKPKSPSEKLQKTILEQFEAAYPWLEAAPRIEDVSLGWLIQEYICGESHDYSFGVYQAGQTGQPEQQSSPIKSLSFPKLSNLEKRLQSKINASKNERIYVKVEPSIPILPFNDADELSPAEEAKQLAESPIIDLKLTSSRSEIIVHLRALIAHYFQLPFKLVTPEADLVDEVERHVWARELGVDFEDVSYGRIFSSEDNTGNLVGGISDRGLLMSCFMMMDLVHGVGVLH